MNKNHIIVLIVIIILILLWIFSQKIESFSSNQECKDKCHTSYSADMIKYFQCVNTC